jgi:hypothetical protein
MRRPGIDGHLALPLAAERNHGAIAQGEAQFVRLAEESAVGFGLNTGVTMFGRVSARRPREVDPRFSTQELAPTC